MRQVGERVKVSFPSSEDFNREGHLVKIVAEFGHTQFKQIWEVKLNAKDGKPEKIARYNEFWLHRID